MGKRPKLKILVSSLIVVVALVALAVVPVMAQAPVGCAFEGELTVDGLPGDPGCLVRATVAATGTTATVATTVAGLYPWVMLVGTDADVDQVVTFEVQPAGSTVWLPAQTFVDGMPVTPLFVRYGHETVDLVVGAAPEQVSLTMLVTGSVLLANRLAGRER